MRKSGENVQNAKHIHWHKAASIHFRASNTALKPPLRLYSAICAYLEITYMRYKDWIDSEGVEPQLSLVQPPSAHRSVVIFGGFKLFSSNNRQTQTVFMFAQTENVHKLNTLWSTFQSSPEKSTNHLLIFNAKLHMSVRDH